MARWVSHQEIGPLDEKDFEQTKCLRPLETQVDAAIARYFAKLSHGVDVTLAVLREVGPSRLADVAGHLQPKTRNQILGICVAQRLEAKYPGRVETLREPEPSRKSVTAAIHDTDLKAWVTCYSLHRINGGGGPETTD